MLIQTTNNVNTVWKRIKDRNSTSWLKVKTLQLFFYYRVAKTNLCAYIAPKST